MEKISALLVLCAGNSPVTGEFPSQRPVARSFDVFFDLRLNKRLSKQSWGWWFEAPSCSLWRHCNTLGLYKETAKESSLSSCPPNLTKPKWSKYRSNRIVVIRCDVKQRYSKSWLKTISVCQQQLFSCCPLWDSFLTLYLGIKTGSWMFPWHECCQSG